MSFQNECETFPTYLTFGDVLLKPNYSVAKTRKKISVATNLTKKIKLANPFISSPMDTVTESKMAIAMAKQGGIGIIHRYMTVEQQAAEVAKVKRTKNIIIEDPYRIAEGSTVHELKELMKETGVGAIIVADKETKTKLKGFITTQDLDLAYLKHGRLEIHDMKVETIMVPSEKLIVLEEKNLKHAKAHFEKFKRKKYVVIDKENTIKGLVTLRDFVETIKRPFASVDENGKLLVGAAIGVKNYMERAKALIDAGVNILCVDIAHGDSLLAVECIQQLKKEWPEIDIMAGSVATKEGTERLIKAGADCIRVGVGSGSICTTRIVTGFGVPQLSAVLEAGKIGKKYGIPIISDGGSSGKSGNMVKSLCAGAQCIMLGSTLAGCEESPGVVLTKDGKRVKMIRGMASSFSNAKRGTKLTDKSGKTSTYSEEGVEGYIPYSGPVRAVISKLVGGIQSGVSYNGASNLNEMREKARFIRITNSGLRESKHHDIAKM